MINLMTGSSERYIRSQVAPAVMRPTDLVQGYFLLPEAAAYLRMSKRMIPILRKYGLIPAIRYGRNFVYRREDLDLFAREWSGYDLRNERKIQAAIAEKAWRQKRGYE